METYTLCILYWIYHCFFFSLYILCVYFLPAGKKGDAPSAKRVKLEEGGGEEDEEEMEEGGGGLDISVGGQAVATMKMVPVEAVDAEKKAAMIRSGKSLEERQEEFKEMLLERGVSEPLAKLLSAHSNFSSPCSGVCLLDVGQGAAQICL